MTSPDRLRERIRDLKDECCKDWALGNERINGPIVLEQLRSGRSVGEGHYIPWSFCPWCGASRVLPAGVSPALSEDDREAIGIVRFGCEEGAALDNRVTFVGVGVPALRRVIALAQRAAAPSSAGGGAGTAREREAGTAHDKISQRIAMRIRGATVVECDAAANDVLDLFHDWDDPDATRTEGNLELDALAVASNIEKFEGWNRRRNAHDTKRADLADWFSIVVRNYATLARALHSAALPAGEDAGATWHVAPDCISPSQCAAIHAEGGVYVCKNCHRHNALAPSAHPGVDTETNE